MPSRLSFSLAALLAGCTAVQEMDTAPPVEMETRAASRAPADGLTEMVVQGWDDTVYVAEQVLLANEDIASAGVVAGPDGPRVEIVFTEAGAQRLAAATREHLSECLAILIDGHVVCAPVVRSEITGGRALITGRFTEDEARRIVGGLAPR